MGIASGDSYSGGGFFDRPGPEGKLALVDPALENLRVILGMMPSCGGFLRMCGTKN
jgi:hypothetical protein